MPDQADQLRQLACTTEPPARCGAARPPMLAVTGGKPGVGATTVAVNVGAALADSGMRVVIVDAALEHANLAQMAGIYPNSSDALREVLEGSRSVTSALQPGPAGSLLLCNGAATNRPPDDSRRAQQRLLAELQQLATMTDLVIVDTGSGVTPWTRRFWQRTGLVIVVSTADDHGIRDSYATIKLAAADQLDAQLCLLVNQCETHLRAHETHRRLSTACKRFLSREVPAVPYLPLHQVSGSVESLPRVWETPESPFGHAVLWLGRAISDLLAAPVSQLAVNAETQLAP